MLSDFSRLDNKCHKDLGTVPSTGRGQEVTSILTHPRGWGGGPDKSCSHFGKLFARPKQSTYPRIQALTLSIYAPETSTLVTGAVMSPGVLHLTVPNQTQPKYARIERTNAVRCFHTMDAI
jgi:hypothetical protein